MEESLLGRNTPVALEIRAVLAKHKVWSRRGKSMPLNREGNLYNAYVRAGHVTPELAPVEPSSSWTRMEVDDGQRDEQDESADHLEELRRVLAARQPTELERQKHSSFKSGVFFKKKKIHLFVCVCGFFFFCVFLCFSFFDFLDFLIFAYFYIFFNFLSFFYIFFIFCFLKFFLSSIFSRPGSGGWADFLNLLKKYHLCLSIPINSLCTHVVPLFFVPTRCVACFPLQTVLPSATCGNFHYD